MKLLPFPEMGIMLLKLPPTPGSIKFRAFAGVGAVLPLFPDIDNMLLPVVPGVGIMLDAVPGVGIILLPAAEEETT
jgi:hypothetical protein